ncbi:YojF family protein [Fervidibacillus halotolerans]|uniref:YojF family protein n=1 Tax=Fervidibacillus halotolerans TaxID=2980027 RepID=A0A9E8LZ47_9BACI|nr:YojF family protein [Fervidibacillus halotolerans]WAA12231.1 YojF family protein [Fervidibacillus halotolerans]
MQLIDKTIVQNYIDSFANKEIFIHLETTNGAYASHKDESFLNAGAFIRNAKIRFSLGKITGEGPYRIGLKLDSGWVYGEGLTHFERDEKGRLLMAGLNSKGQLAIALELSETPFD